MHAESPGGAGPLTTAGERLPERRVPAECRVSSRGMSAVSTGPPAEAGGGGPAADRQRRRRHPAHPRAWRHPARPRAWRLPALHTAWRHLIRRPAWRLPESREDRIAVIGLAVVLAAGAVLRLLFVFAWRPAFMGWPDAASYIDVSQGELFSSTLRPAGYPLFLRGLHALVPSLLFVIVVQHVLGLASAALLYLAVARAGVPRPLGLVPAAIVALGGDVMFLEHSPISEGPFIFLVSVALYAAVRSQEEGASLRWPAICGLTLFAAASVRVLAVPLLPLFGLWVLAGTHLPFRRRLSVLAVGAASALVLLGAYYVAEERAVGQTGLSRNGIWNVYGRVAPFADCSKFTPPPGTERLCETTPRPRRAFTFQYTFNWYWSPAVRYFGNPHTATPEQTDQVAAFAWAVIVGQPLDYAEEVGAGLLRYVAPESFRGYGGGPSYHDLVHAPVLFHPLFRREGRKVATKHYVDARKYSVDPTLIDVLRTYESGTRIQGPLFVLIAVLSLAAAFVTRGRARGAALLFALAGWTLCVVPVATVEFSGRTAPPSFGPLAAAAALGGWGVAAAVRARHRPRAATGRRLAEEV